MTDDLERRLAAVERAVDGDAPASATTSDGAGPPDSPDSLDRDDLERRIADIEARVDELDAAIQAVRGFLGGVSAVNESVERRADAAVAAVERLERRIDEEHGGTGSPALDGLDEVVHGDEATTLDGDPVPDDDSASNNDPASDDGLRERLRDLR